VLAATLRCRSLISCISEGESASSASEAIPWCKSRSSCINSLSLLRATLPRIISLQECPVKFASPVMSSLSSPKIAAVSEEIFRYMGSPIRVVLLCLMVSISLNIGLAEKESVHVSGKPQVVWSNMREPEKTCLPNRCSDKDATSPLYKELVHT
jgi:hypothetical protein